MDESTLIMSFITSMVEREESKGSGYAASTTLSGFTDDAGKEAARNAIAGIGGVRVPTGDYRVVFGREAVMEILHYIVVPGLDAGVSYAAGSPFLGKLGQQSASQKLRIWYTYPVNGLRAGDFTGTVVADSYVIKDGKLAEPIKPNTLRINENVHKFLNGVIGVAKEGKPTLVWAADEIVYAPEIAVEKVHIDAIAEYMETI